MPVYEIYKRDGTPVRVEGPEGATFSELATALGANKANKVYIANKQLHQQELIVRHR